MLQHFFDELPTAMIAQRRGELEVVTVGVMTMKATIVIATAFLVVAGVGGGARIASGGSDKTDRAGVAAAPPAQMHETMQRDDAPQPTVTEASAAPSADDEKAGASGKADPSRKRSAFVEKMRAEMSVNNLGTGYTIDDDGPEMREALEGLETESLDLVPFVDYLESRFEDSWLVAGSVEAETKTDDRKDLWVDGYENPEGEVSAAFRSARDEKGRQSIVVGVLITRWGNELELGVDRDKDVGMKINPRLNLLVSRSADGRVSGSLMVNYQPTAQTKEKYAADVAKLAELGRSHRLPADATWSTKDGAGDLHYWPATAGRLQTGNERSQRPLRSEEIGRLTQLLDRCFERAKEVRESQTK